MENEEEKSLRLSIVRLTITTERATTTTTTYHNHYGGRKRNDSNDWSIVALSTMIQWKKKEVDCLVSKQAASEILHHILDWRKNTWRPFNSRKH